MDTGERIDVGTGPGIDLDLTIPAGEVIDLSFDHLVGSTSKQTDPALSGIDVQALPPHLVDGVGGAVTVPWRASNIIINNFSVLESLFFTINEGLIAELPGEDAIEMTKKNIYRVVIQGVAGERVAIHTW